MAEFNAFTVSRAPVCHLRAWKRELDSAVSEQSVGEHVRQHFIALSTLSLYQHPWDEPGSHHKLRDVQGPEGQAGRS